MAELEEIKGVGSTTAAKLRSAGLTTPDIVAATPIREIVSKTGMAPETAVKVSQYAREMVGVDFTTAAELFERRKGMLRCSTGSKKLNEMFCGGIETQAMTELIGEYGVGKTQICLMLSVMAQLPKEQGGLEGKAVYQDTEGTFIPERVYQIASARELDAQKILENIIYVRVENSDHQCLVVDKLFKVCAEENVKMVIVDSVISHFRGEYVGRESLSERQQRLNNYLHKLLRLAEAFNLAVVVTNQVQANPAQFFGNPNRPAGGHVVAHACTHRIFIYKGKKGTRLAKVEDSPYLPESSARFRITNKGIEDTEEEEKEADTNE